MRTLSTPFAAALLLMLLLSVASNGVMACNTTYCSFRGNGTNNTFGTDGCSCQCEWPYFGYRCRSEFVNPKGIGTLIDCTGDSTLNSDPALCNGTDQCFWNSSESLCRNRALPWYANRNATPISLTVPWCYRLIDLPLQVTVYSFACAAFGVGGVGFFYLMRYRRTYSSVDTTGERVFNQFFENPYPSIIMSGLLFLSAGLLGITAYINFRDPTVCAFVIFFYLYIAVQLFVFILYAVKWTAEFCYARYSRPEKRMVELDEHTKPTKRDIMTDKRKCQVRCF